MLSFEGSRVYIDLVLTLISPIANVLAEEECWLICEIPLDLCLNYTGEM